MPDYQKRYAILFNALTDAIAQLDRQNYGSARDTLIRAHQCAEEAYISEEQNEP